MDITSSICLLQARGRLKQDRDVDRHVYLAVETTAARCKMVGVRLAGVATVDTAQSALALREQAVTVNALDCGYVATTDRMWLTHSTHVGNDCIILLYYKKNLGLARS